jgi:hypothetical protein
VIVNDGKLLLLDAQRTYLTNLYWGLFTTNTAIVNTTVFADFTEAAWSGYARVVAGSWQAPTLIANKAVTLPNSFPAFGNSSGSPQNFYGWFLYDNSASKLIAAVNIGLTVLPDGATFPLAPSVTDDQA